MLKRSMHAEFKIVRKMGKSKIHEDYCRKLKELGDLLGYDTDIPRSGLYHLANPDAVWYIDTKIEGFHKIPLMVFEVLYSEGEKAIRGSVSSVLIYGSPIGVLVMIREGYKHRKKRLTEEENIAHFKGYIRKLIDSFGLERRIFLWTEDQVDSLLTRHQKLL